MAGGAVVERASQDRQAGRDASHPGAGAGLLDEQLIAARARGREKHAVRIVGELFAGAEDPDQAIDGVVVGREVVVGDGPVVAQAVDRLAAEVIGSEAEGDPSPVVGAAAEHTGAPPAELGAGGDGVGLALDLPSADATVELSEGMRGRRGAAAGGVVGPFEHRAVGGGAPWRARLQHDHIGACLREHVGRHAATGAGPDDGDIVDVLPRLESHAVRGGVGRSGRQRRAIKAGDQSVSGRIQISRNRTGL